jgi:hypothetical protein
MGLGGVVAAGCCPSLKMPMLAALAVLMLAAWEGPAVVGLRGLGGDGAGGRGRGAGAMRRWSR